MSSIGGTWYIMPTTFDEKGELDLSSQQTMTDAVINWGIDGITLLGVMGEASALTIEERAKVLKSVVKTTNGKVPIAVGCSASAPYAAAELCNQAQNLGADYAMVSAPQLLRDVDALPGFYRRLRERTKLPLILQDEPAATGVLVPVSIWATCLKESNSTTLKLEDPPTASKITTLLKLAPDTRIFGGLGGAAAYYEMVRGAVGTMTGFTFPEILRDIRLALAGNNRHRAFEIYTKYLPLIMFEAQPVVGLGIRKELLKRRGVIKTATTRIGPVSISAPLLEELDEVLRELLISPNASAFVVE
jgi:4-hydroxy-tetrahydrodipicolinate synthase